MNNTLDTYRKTLYNYKRDELYSLIVFGLFLAIINLGVASAVEGIRLAVSMIGALAAILSVCNAGIQLEKLEEEN